MLKNIYWITLNFVKIIIKRKKQKKNKLKHARKIECVFE